MPFPDASRRWRLGDPRLYQIATLASLLAYGLLFLNFDITVARVVVLLATVVVTQAACDHLASRYSAVNVRSALISGLSLCLLLRTNRPELAVLAAVLTIAGKFLLRFRGKHLFNPTNGGLVAMLILTDQVWVSPGQRRGEPRLAQRRDVRVHRLLRRAAVRPVALSRRAARHSASSNRERRAAAVHLLYDLGPEDDPGLQSRPCAVCR